MGGVECNSQLCKAGVQTLGVYLIEHVGGDSAGKALYPFALSMLYRA